MLSGRSFTRAGTGWVKSRADPLARGDVAWWLALGLMLAGIRRARRHSGALQVVLCVTQRTPTLLREAAALGLSLVEEGGGYVTLLGGPLDAKVIMLDEVCTADREPLLGLFSGATLDEPAVQRWFLEHAGRVIHQMGSKVTQTNDDFIDELLASLPVKRLLKRLDPEQRLAGLDAEEILEALEALPASDQQVIGRRFAAMERADEMGRKSPTKGGSPRKGKRASPAQRAKRKPPTKKGASPRNTTKRTSPSPAKRAKPTSSTKRAAPAKGDKRTARATRTKGTPRTKGAKRTKRTS